MAALKQDHNSLCHAMGRRQDMDIVDERTSTELAAIVEKRRYPRPFVRVRIMTTNDTFRILSEKRNG